MWSSVFMIPISCSGGAHICNLQWNAILWRSNRRRNVIWLNHFPQQHSCHRYYLPCFNLSWSLLFFWTLGLYLNSLESSRRRQWKTSHWGTRGTRASSVSSNKVCTDKMMIMKAWGLITLSLICLEVSIILWFHAIIIPMLDRYR